MHLGSSSWSKESTKMEGCLRPSYLSHPNNTFLPISTYLTYGYLSVSLYLRQRTYLCLLNIYLPMTTSTYLPLPIIIYLYIIAADPGTGSVLFFTSAPVKVPSYYVLVHGKAIFMYRNFSLCRRLN